MKRLSNAPRVSECLWCGCLQVVLKIIKHYQEEGRGSEVVQGVLLGLVVEDRLEITNCFPFPQHTEDDADFDEGNPALRRLIHLQLLTWYPRRGLVKQLCSARHISSSAQSFL